MAPTEGKVGKPERHWGCCSSSAVPAITETK